MSHRIGEAAQHRDAWVRCGREQAVARLPAPAWPESLLRAPGPAAERATARRRRAEGWISRRPRAWREASTSATTFLFIGAVSSRASRIAPRSRIETRSRSSCSRTRPTSPRVSSLGTSSSISLGWLSLSEVHQALGLGPAQQLPGMLADQFAQVGRDDRNRVDDRVAGGDGLVLEGGRDPDGRNAEGRLARFLAGQRAAMRVAGDGQQVAALRSASGRSRCRAARTDTRAA